MADEETSAAEAATADAAPAAEPQTDPRAVATVALGSQANLQTAHGIVEAWFDTHCRNSPIGRDTPAWNHLLGCLPHLKALIAQEL